jgi:hypothetical protein
MISLVGVFLAFGSMVLCVGLEDLFERKEMKEKEKKRKGEGQQRVASMKRN